MQELTALQLSGMSARERNRAKRKAKQMARRQSVDCEALERRYLIGVWSSCARMQYMHMCSHWSVCLSLPGHSDSADSPKLKRPRTTSVLVEQAGQSDKVLIDQVTDTETAFDEVLVYLSPFLPHPLSHRPYPLSHYLYLFPHLPYPCHTP